MNVMSSTAHIKRFWRYYLLFLVLLCLLVLLVLYLFQRIEIAQSEEIRQVAYAATATDLARLRPSATFAPTVIPSPTPLPTLAPTPILIPTVQDLHILPTPTPTVSLLSDVPPSATPHSYATQYDLVNFLVLGSDRYEDSGAYRTDVIVLASVNRAARTVNLLSVPRDLYVYIPGWGWDRINTAEIHQLQTHLSSHRLGLLAETIEYNFGIPIHHLARVDFGGFRTLIDLLGGITVPVDCAVSGYRLRNSDLITNSLSDWVPFTLEPGIYHMDGDLALWYVRQRMDSSDFDRNRRQQIVLRALWHQARQANLMQNLPALWGQLTSIVETDLTIGESLELLSLLPDLNPSRIEGHFLGLDEVDLWQTPTGANVLVIDPLPFQATITHFLTPPTENRLAQERASVIVMNASSMEAADQLAVARLEGLGLTAFSQGRAESERIPRTTIYDHTGRVKGSSLEALQAALRVRDDDVVIAPSSGSDVDFTILIGEDYVPCITTPWQPLPQPD